MIKFIKKQKLQNLLLSIDGNIDKINMIHKFIQKEDLFKDQNRSISTMKLIASVVYARPKLFSDVILLLKKFKKITIDTKFLNEKISNKDVTKRSIIVYVLLNLSGHLKMNEIRSSYKGRHLCFIDPGGKFPNKYRNKLFDYEKICKMTREERKTFRNKMHSTHPLAITILNDDVESLQKILSSTNYEIEDRIPFSHFEFYDILKDANAIQYAAFYGSINCFKFLLKKSLFIDFSKLLEYAIAGGNYDIIHITENESHDQKITINQNLLYLAILHMNNDLIEYILDNYYVNVDDESYNKCIYSSNYEAMTILREYDNKSIKIKHDKTTPIEIAVSEGYIDFFKYMIYMKIIENKELIKESQNLLQIAMTSNQKSIIEYIKKKKMFIDLEEENKYFI